MPNGIYVDDDIELPDESECSDGAIHHYWLADMNIRKLFLEWIAEHHDPGNHHAHFEP